MAEMDQVSAEVQILGNGYVFVLSFEFYSVAEFDNLEIWL
jgi:hypothetical protein